MDQAANKAVDSIQQRLTSYAVGLTYEMLTPAAIHGAKVRVIDTFGALVGGFFGEPCSLARNIAAQTPDVRGATVIGTRFKAMPDMAAFANAIAARHAELNDAYQWPKSGSKGHPSDTLMSVFVAAEHAGASGRDFITGVVLAYEVYQRICDVFRNLAAFDNTTFASLAGAIAAGKLLGLSHDQLAQCISMAIVPNNTLRQAKGGNKSMFKSAGSGQAARAALFAALLARAGMEGPHLPFEGKAGWCAHVALERFSLPEMGGAGIPFKICDSYIKPRPAAASAMSSILAAEKAGPLNIGEVARVTVETYAKAKEGIGSGERPWNPQTREDADHSIPYLVAVALQDGIVNLRSFDDAHLHSAELHALMQKIEVVANDEFTHAFELLPQQYCARVTVITRQGEQRVGESGGEKGDLAAAKSDSQIEDKFRGLTEDCLGTGRVRATLDQLWDLEKLGNVAAIPPRFVII